MRIVCPTCDAAYQVPDSALAARKTVKCARCGNSWAPLGDDEPPVVAPVAAPVEAVVVAPVAAPAPPPVVDPVVVIPLPVEPIVVDAPAANVAPPAAAPPAAPKPKPAAAPVVDDSDEFVPEDKARGGSGLAISIAIVLAAGLAAVMFREQIMQAWPASAHLFAAIGLGGS